MTTAAGPLSPETGRGRQVRILSLSFPPGLTVTDVLALAEREVDQDQLDLVILPETWHTPEDGPAEAIDGPTVTGMAQMARDRNTYVVCPLDRMQAGRRLNSSVLIDRSGQVLGAYDKVYPYWSEFDKVPIVRPGSSAVVWDTDFGKLGAATASAQDLRVALADAEPTHPELMSEDEVLAAVNAARAHGERIVMTNGCFDLLHAGHVQYLRQARSLGERLLVAVNDDDFQIMVK